MKKLLIVAFAVLATTAFAVTPGKKDKKDKKKVQTEQQAPVQLISQNDSLSYAAGMFTTRGLMDYVKQSSTSTSACVLLHDTNDKKTTVDALPQIIEYYKSFGYEFDALNENVTGFRHKANN